jgi:hypothetical protein
MPRMNILNAVEREAFNSPPVFNSFQRKQYFDFPSTPIRRWPPQSGLAEACKCSSRTASLLELSLPFAEVRRDQGYRQPGGVSRRGGHGSAVAWQHLNLLGLLGREACETESEFDPQNWWTKWGAIFGVAQSPKIQSIKGDKRNGHVAFGTFVGI